MSRNRHNQTTVLLVGEEGAGKSELARLLAGADCPNGIKNGNNGGDVNTVSKLSLRVETSRLSAPGGRGYRIVDTPGCDAIMSPATEPDSLARLISEIEKLQKLNAIVLVFKAEKAFLQQSHVDFVNIVRGVFGLEFIRNLLIVFTDWPLDSASIEMRRKQGISQEDKTAELTKSLNKQFGVSHKYASFVLDAFEKASINGEGEGTKRLADRDQELRRLLLAAGHMDAVVPRTDDQLVADQKVIQEAVDTCLNIWNEARACLIDDILREFEMSKDKMLQRMGRQLKMKIDMTDQAVERDFCEENVTIKSLVRTPEVERLEELLIGQAKSKAFRVRQELIGMRWSTIDVLLAEVAKYLNGKDGVEGLTSSQFESLIQSLSLTRGLLGDLCAEAHKYCETNNNVSTKE